MKHPEPHTHGGLSHHRIRYFEDGGDAGDGGGGDAGSADAGSADAGSAVGAEAGPGEGVGAEAGPGEGIGAEAGPGESGPIGAEASPGENAPGGANFGADIGFGTQASQMGLGTIGNGPMSADGYTQGELQNMQANGLGNMSLGNQTVDQALAALGVASMTPGQMSSLMGMVAPPLGAALGLFNNIQGVVSGQSSLGSAAVNAAIGLVANQMGLPSNVVAGVINGNPGQAVSGPVAAAIANGVASALGVPTNAISGLMGVSGVTGQIASGINSALGTSPSGQSNTSALASAINGSLGNVASSSGAPGGLSVTGGTGSSSEPASGSEMQAVADGAPADASSNVESSLGALALAGMMGAGNTGSSWLDTSAQALEPQKVEDGTPNTPEALKLAELQNIYDQISPELLDILVSRGAVPAAHGGSIANYASGSSVTTSSVSDSPLWGALGNLAPKFAAAAPAMISTGPSRRQKMELAPLKHINDGLASGGLPAKYQQAAPKGHNPEFITGLTGFYANGKGTGQSDDIPAMLHDGDYVMDADTVAALGDGSSKAGAMALEGLRKEVPHRMSTGGNAVPAKIADGEYVFPEAFVTALGNGDNKRGAKMLDTIRENLRAHKRSAPTSKIPPKALSPLDYLKKSKG